MLLLLYIPRKKSRYERHVENCTDIPENIHKFHNQNFVTFEDNLKYRGDAPFVAFCDFETKSKQQPAIDPKKHWIVHYIVCDYIFFLS